MGKIEGNSIKLNTGLSYNVVTPLLHVDPEALEAVTPTDVCPHVCSGIIHNSQ